jgi:hypothetical protein
MGSGAVIHKLRIPDDVAHLIRNLHPRLKRMRKMNACSFSARLPIEMYWRLPL